MSDIDQTMAPQRRAVSSDADDVTMPGKRDRKPDGRFAVGDLIMNRYKVLAELGQGGMGVVYKCFDETAGIEVALKALPPELSHNTIEMEDIKDNFQLVHNLHHPNIASSNTLEKDDSNGNYYLIMECCEGEDLRHWLRRKRKEGELKLEEVLPIIKQVADALDYAHEMKIIHRDIKPGNIMLDQFGRIKVLDFGLAAQIHTSLTRVSMAYHGTSGTGPYMAPEQWRGRSQGASADQYALAVMTYEMLAGHLPFESADAAVLREAVLNDTPEDIAGIAKNVQAAIKRAMSKEPAMRFANCSDFAAALAGKKIKSARIQKKSGFPKWAAVVIMLAVLGAAGGTGYYFFDKYQKEQARLEQIAAEKAEKERQAKIAADKAEKERQAKIAADKAEKERQAKIAAEKAAQAEKARLAKLTEEQLDSENAALKVELRNKIAEIKRKNYDPAQGFGQKINEMNIAFATAEEAKLLITANKKYKEAKNLADWLLKNGELRKNAKSLKKQAQSNRSAAEKYEPGTYANELFSQAQKLYQTAEKFYNDTMFAEAENSFSEAAKVFEQAENTAFDNKLQFLTGEARKAEESGKWNELKVWAGKIRPLNNSLANQFDAKAENELKAIAVEKKLASARNARTEKNWQSVYDYSVAALNIDNSNTEAQNLKQEAEKNLKPTLEIIATVDGKPVPAQHKGSKRSYDIMNKKLPLKANTRYRFPLIYQDGKTEYAGEVRFTCDWRGHKKITTELKKVEFNGTVTLANGVKLEMVKVEPGTFTMSKRDGENYNAEVEHQKTLTKPFYIGKFEVTQAQYKAVMGTNPSDCKGSNRPVGNVSWREAMSFCEKMNQYAPAGWKFTLPTETQWEFAARGGNRSRGYKYSGSDNLDEAAWFDDNSGNTTHEVGGKAPNELGLYDMSGNVWEWCLDNYESRSNNTSAEFLRSYSDSDGSNRVYRGGGWYGSAQYCRSARRYYSSPGNRFSGLGFRLALVPVQ